MDAIKRILFMFFCFAFAIAALYGVLFAEGETVKQGIVLSGVLGLFMWMEWTRYELKREKNKETEE